MQISVSRSGGGGYLARLEGILDRDSVPELRKKLLKLAKKKKINNLEVELSGVTSIDTAGIALMVELMRFLSRKNGKLRLEGANEHVRRMIHLARLDMIFGMNTRNG